MSGIYERNSNNKYINEDEKKVDLLNFILGNLDGNLSKLSENLSSPQTQRRINEFVGSLEEKIKEKFSPDYSEVPRVSFGSSSPLSVSKPEPVIIPQVNPPILTTNPAPQTNYQPLKKKRHNPEITPEDRAAFERMKVPQAIPPKFLRPPKIPGY
ncbi:hypothetical protein HY837_06570 [archaeon]|nr:hypothetical protein [archaeon]